MSQALQQQPQTFVRLVQTHPSLSRGGMDCERLLVELAERKAALQKEEHPNKRGISPGRAGVRELLRTGMSALRPACTYVRKLLRTGMSARPHSRARSGTDYQTPPLSD